MKIEFGCAGKRLPDDWVGCDIRDSPGVEYICPCWEIHEHVPVDSVSEIYSRHMFEHLTFKQGATTLQSWFAILKPQGEVRMSLPDLHYHAKEYLEFYARRLPNDNWSKRDGPAYIHAIGSFFGWQREREGGERFTAFENDWDVHKSGYDQISLEKLVISCGFEKFKRNEDKWPWNLNVSFSKP